MSTSDLTGTMPYGDAEPTRACGAADAETDRLAAVHRYDILDTPPEDAFDRVAALAARLLDAPIATVTIVDADRVWFKAAVGLDEADLDGAGSGTGRQVGRDPGLCASAVLQDAPYVVTDAAADAGAVNNPLVRGRLGLRFYAAAPITTHDGHRLGTVNVMDRRPRTISPAQSRTLRDLAAIVMDHLELRLSSIRTASLERQLRGLAVTHATRLDDQQRRLREFAGTLRRSLNPPTLPQVPGCEAAAVFHPASDFHVGGDFYDLFPIGRRSRTWGLFVGDVVGKDAEAAALTSLARYTLRTSATIRPNPARALADLNSAITADHDQRTGTDAEWFCTAVIALLRHHRDQVTATISSGGHPPVIVVRADTTIQAVHTGGSLIGCFPDTTFGYARFSLEPGDAAIFHTDGLTDALYQGERFGDTRLHQALAGCAGLGATAIADRLTRLVDEFDRDRRDDIAALILSVPHRRDTGP